MAYWLSITQYVRGRACHIGHNCNGTDPRTPTAAGLITIFVIQLHVGAIPVFTRTNDLFSQNWNENLSEMEVRTFARPKKKTWVPLLATKAKIIQGKLKRREVSKLQKLSA